MDKLFINRTLSNLPRWRSSFIKENWKIVIQFIFVFLLVAVASWFFKHETLELTQVVQVLSKTIIKYIILGIILVGVYIYLQGLMYKYSFASVNETLPLKLTIPLFLKRNFISVFIPAGGVSSLAFFSDNIESAGVKKSKIYYASSIYGFTGILSVVIVAIPIFLYAFLNGKIDKGEWISLLILFIILLIMAITFRSILSKGKAYHLLVKFFPKSEVFLNDILSHNIDTKQLLKTIITSILIDVSGFMHLYIAMYALGFHPTLLTAVISYFTAVVALIVSPFMRGMGAVEVSMAFILTRFGYSSVDAIAIAFLYRFFEFWLPFVSGLITFLLKINKLLFRIVPSLLIFALGIINIISALTPAMATRLIHLKDIIPLSAITASNYFVLIAGALMVLTASFMIKGLKSAWWIAFVLSSISVIAHLTKAIDYEEALVALSVVIILLYSRKEYYIKSDARLSFIGISTSIITICCVIIYGITGFYYLDKSHFNIDFSLTQSIKYTLQNFFLAGSSELVTNDQFAKDFLLSINVSGFLSLSFLFYTILKPYVFKQKKEMNTILRAKELVTKYGNSSLDYFKTYNDKLIYIPENMEAFIAYRITGSFAVVLENPVSRNKEEMIQCISSFETFCSENGLKSLYYRVSEDDLPIYQKFRKKSLFIGQEAICDLETFKLEGSAQKTLRNSVNKAISRGYRSTVHFPPVKDGILQKLKAVSDEWLNESGRKEIVFSQGVFQWEELKQQTIITVENAEEKIVGFVNIIPDYSPNEATFDLIRKTKDAPNGVMDFIIIELFKHLKGAGYRYVNLGLAPMSGVQNPKKIAEETIKFAYNKIKAFAQYRGLREYKDKFMPVWHNKYLIYDHDFDLLQVPSSLNKVIKP